jgi:hypothetical protein
MKQKPKKENFLNLGEELSRFEMKSIVGGTEFTNCTGGNYAIGCSPAYCQAAGHGSFVSCSGNGGSTWTNCTGGSYAIGCQPAYCAGAGHGSYVSCG